MAESLGVAKSQSAKLLKIECNGKLTDTKGAW